MLDDLLALYYADDLVRGFISVSVMLGLALIVGVIADALLKVIDPASSAGNK
ncbi:MAG: hypothetical protein HYY04_01360 [Chloroflexi bacterium]|nr:hypothetical protein [Chloroflexota bacterium]